MSLREADGAPGAPWGSPLAGTLDELVVESELLADNPLGDPARRPLYVYRSPGARSNGAVPSVYVIQGYSGQVDRWLGRVAFEPTIIERLDAMFAAGECPDAIVVFVDAWTSLGGSQFLNSSSTGRYMDYLCDEVVAFVEDRYPVAPGRDHRGLTGKSSGGYGAMVVPMLRPDAFGALASHAGDALFEACYQRDFPVIARTLRDHFDGSYDALVERAREGDHFDWERFGMAFSMYAYATAYTPDPDRPGRRLFRSTSPPAVSSTTSGRSGWSSTRCGWRHATPTRFGACAGSISTPAGAMSTSSTSARRLSPTSSRASAWSTRSSCSRESTAASTIATRVRSGN